MEVKTVLTILGTRPEAVKLAPVLKELGRRKSRFRSCVCVTGQYPELLDPMLDFFGIRPDSDLRVMRESQPLASLTARLLAALDPVLVERKPDWVVVQGDTTTVMAAALAADIINEDIGCKAKFRKGIRHGNYTPPPGGGAYYYSIRPFEERLRMAWPGRPPSFSECVEPIGFEIPKDAHGDRLKASFNYQPQCRARSDLREVLSA